MKKLLIICVALLLTFTLAGCEEEQALDCVGKDGTPIVCDGDTNSVDNHIYEGTYIVGDTIEAGMYFFEVNAGTGTVKRLGASDVVIAEVTLSSRTYIEVKSTDVSVQVIGGSLISTTYTTPQPNMTIWNVGGWLVGDEIPAGDYQLKVEPGETLVTLNIVSAVDFEAGSVTETITHTVTADGLDITIPSSAYAIFIIGGHIAPRD